MVTDAAPDEVPAALERLRQSTPTAAGFSAGVAAWRSGEGLEELMQRADLALYGAEGTGTAKLAVAPPLIVRRSAGHAPTPAEERLVARS